MKLFTFLLPIFMFLVFLFIKIALPDSYETIIQEDSFIEYLQVGIYFLSSGIALLIALKFFRKSSVLLGILYSTLTLCFLFIAFEEMSWGQRIFNFSNPEYFESYNTQKELSVHNLIGVQRKLHKIYILIGAYGTFTWIFASFFSPRNKAFYSQLINHVVPEWYLSSYFFFTFFIYTAFRYISKPYPEGFLLWRDQEPAELLLSLGFLIFTINNYYKLDSGKQSDCLSK